MVGVASICKLRVVRAPLLGAGVVFGVLSSNLNKWFEVVSGATNSTKEDEVVSILNTYFSGSCERVVLSHKLEQLLGLSRNAASMRIARALRKGTWTVEGKTNRAESCSTQCNNVTLSQGCVTSVTSDNVLHDVTPLQVLHRYSQLRMLHRYSVTAVR